MRVSGEEERVFQTEETATVKDSRRTVEKEMYMECKNKQAKPQVWSLGATQRMGAFIMKILTRLCFLIPLSLSWKCHSYVF